MERLIQLHGGDSGAREAIRAHLVTDEEIERAIRSGLDEWGQVWDPHTATAVVAREAISTPHWVLVSTAHPAKFEQIVEPLVGQAIEVPASLAALLSRQMYYAEIDPELSELVTALSSRVVRQVP